MTSWASIAKENTSNKLNNKTNLQTIVKENITIDNSQFDKECIKNKHISNVLEIYNVMLDKVNNGYYTVLTVDTNNRQNQFINMIFNNMNIDYHLKYDIIDSDSDIQENLNSDEEVEFTASYSKFAYI